MTSAIKPSAVSARLGAAAGLLSLGLSCLGLGLPLVALAVVVAWWGAPEWSRRGAALLVACVVALLWWGLAWVTVGLAVDSGVRFVVAVSLVAGALAPFVFAASARAEGAPSFVGSLDATPLRCALVAFGAGASLAPLLLLSPLVGYLSGALVVAAALTLWLIRSVAGGPRAASATDAIVPDDLDADRWLPLLAVGLLAACCSWATVLLVPSAAHPVALLPEPSESFGASMATPSPNLRVSPRDDGFAVEARDGGGAGAIGWAHGRPERVAFVRAPDGLRVCIGRAAHAACVDVDAEGVRRDDGPVGRLRAGAGATDVALMMVALSLLVLLGVFGARWRSRVAAAVVVVAGLAWSALAVARWI